LDDELGGGAGKQKKKQKKVKNVEKKVDPENDASLTPYKGKPSSFFVMN
jgi:hypothetical protein